MVELVCLFVIDLQRFTPNSVVPNACYMYFQHKILPITSLIVLSPSAVLSEAGHINKLNKVVNKEISP